MSSTCYNLSEDWGWYIDIENLKPVYHIRSDFIKIQNKKLNQHYNKLETIIEDEYDYYLNNQKNLDDITITNNPEKTIDNNNKQYYLSKNLLNIGSTTMITALLTYVIFFML